MKQVRAILLWVMLAVATQAIPPGEYEQMFGDLSAMVDGAGLTPGQMMAGSWTSIKYFGLADGRLAFNQSQFASAKSQGRAAVSGLFLAIHGGDRAHLLVRSELETNPVKRKWLWMNFGTEKMFFWRLKEGMMFQPLTRTLPSTDGLRAQLRLLMQSRDPLIRRAGLFWGSWLVDDGYRWRVNQMASADPDPVNRACASRLMTVMR